MQIEEYEHNLIALVIISARITAKLAFRNSKKVP
jgi:hypothetical protein